MIPPLIDGPNGDLHRRLYAIQQQMADIRALAIISIDGKLIASILPEEVEIDALAESTTMPAMAQHLLTALDGGSFYQLFVRGSNGYIVVTELNSKAVFIALTTNSVKLALMLLELKRAANDLAPFL